MQAPEGFEPALPERLSQSNIDVLRLDRIHPVISGNKWFKLRFYIEEAMAAGKTTLLSYGGAWSNHIIALAAAAEMHGMKSIGLIRGDFRGATLQAAREYGMQIYFLSRDAYRQQVIPTEVWAHNNEEDVYVIREGGYGITGARGASTMLDNLDLSSFDHIVAATGTGTMLAGLALRIALTQKLTGISVLKNNFSITSEINLLLPEEKQNTFTVLHQYHFGGYAKASPALFDFMNNWFMKTGIPTDFVYTAKVFYAVNDLLEQGILREEERVLVIHSGGLQGNASLPNGTLIF